MCTEDANLLVHIRLPINHFLGHHLPQFFSTLIVLARHFDLPTALIGGVLPQRANPFLEDVDGLLVLQGGRVVIPEAVPKASQGVDLVAAGNSALRLFPIRFPIHPCVWELRNVCHPKARDKTATWVSM